MIRIGLRGWNALPYRLVCGDPRTQRRDQLALLSTHGGQLVATHEPPPPETVGPFSSQTEAWIPQVRFQSHPGGIFLTAGQASLHLWRLTSGPGLLGSLPRHSQARQSSHGGMGGREMIADWPWNQADLGVSLGSISWVTLGKMSSPSPFAKWGQ